MQKLLSEAQPRTEDKGALYLSGLSRWELSPKPLPASSSLSSGDAPLSQLTIGQSQQPAPTACLGFVLPPPICREAPSVLLFRLAQVSTSYGVYTTKTQRLSKTLAVRKRQNTPWQLHTRLLAFSIQGATVSTGRAWFGPLGALTDP